MSMTTSLWNCWRNATARRPTRTQASGSSPFTWKIGRLHRLRDVGRVDRRPGGLDRGREPELVVDHEVDRAAGAVAVQL